MRLPLLTALLAPVPAWAAAVPAIASPSPLAGIMQVVLGLAVVLAAIAACAWMFRKVSAGALGGGSRLKVVSAVMVGQRERVVVVEIEGEWLVLGVTAQAINRLARMPRPASADVDAPAGGGEPFARWLKAAIDKARPSSDKAVS
ncbi:flagellar biosynthetic protein FliO [Paludibacterium yongneupense]|uniref:flagellar biosynthetic protein FliO n=1 Tax=Paludibacterium yongneupense TaxID=400061 RepID=UPI00042117C7|nr:flagellar biosynthetic protein FliO [Paludibacterium yongneupense]